jgi:hypothetical protein
MVWTTFCLFSEQMTSPLTLGKWAFPVEVANQATLT